MDAFLAMVLTFPTVVFTAGLGLAALYWVFVIVGAADLHLFESADGIAEGLAEGATEGLAEGLAEGASEGLAEGLAEGASEGLAEGVAEGAAEGAADGAMEGAAHAHPAVEAHGSGLAGLIHALKLRNAPATVVLSFQLLFGWVLSGAAVHYLGPSLGAVLPAWAFGCLTLVLAFVFALPLTSMAVRPMGHVFVVQQAQGKGSLVGKTCHVTTGEVTERFGQAEVHTDSGAGVVIDVRVSGGARLTRGQEALIIDFDREHDVFLVEAFDLNALGQPEQRRLPAKTAQARAGAERNSASDATSR